MTAHALLSPSSAHRWRSCPGSVVLIDKLPVVETSSQFADEGTAAHFLASECLIAGEPAQSFKGREIIVFKGDTWFNAESVSIPEGANVFTVDDEMADNVQVYLDYINREGGEIMVEQRLSIEHLTGEKDAKGTSDCVIIKDEELIIVDLKYGRGVRVDAQENDQLAMYALAALAEFDFIADFKTVRTVIVQPRLNHISEWSVSVTDLEAEGEKIRADAKHAFALLNEGGMIDADLNPSEKACKFCEAKGVCPKLAAQNLEVITGGFVDLDGDIKSQVERAIDREIDNDTLGRLLQSVDLIENWIKALRARAETELLAGRSVSGFKLVEGRRGARKWADEAEAEATLKTMRLKVEQMFDLKLISPTTAEKLHKSGEIGPRQWPRLQELITQANGSPSVAPESDKRPALVMQSPEAEFENLEQREIVFK